MIITMLPPEALAGRKGIQKPFFGKHAQKFWCGFGDADSPIFFIDLDGASLDATTVLSVPRSTSTKHRHARKVYLNW